MLISTFDRETHKGRRRQVGLTDSAFPPFLFAHKAGECKQVNKSKDILNSL